MKKDIRKTLIRTAKKVGVFAYDAVTDEMLSKADKVRRASRMQENRKLYNLSNEELVKRYESSEYGTTERFALQKEIRERQLEKEAIESGDYSELNSYYDGMDNIKSYGDNRFVDYNGIYISEDNNILIRVEECTDVEIFFAIYNRETKMLINYCRGKFFGENKVFYAGQKCDLFIEWYSEEEFFLKGKFPWESDDVEMYFTKPYLYEEESSEEEVDDFYENISLDILVKGQFVAKHCDSGQILEIEEKDDDVVITIRTYAKGRRGKRIQFLVTSVNSNVIEAESENGKKDLFKWLSNDEIIWLKKDTANSDKKGHLFRTNGALVPF